MGKQLTEGCQKQSHFRENLLGQQDQQEEPNRKGGLSAAQRGVLCSAGGTAPGEGRGICREFRGRGGRGS